ncbi:hypothetical protein [Arthrobacter methylotrophus]|uniref:hypothetical protein n=1 Tax=Arthrobacter methylotrophus TaxID=121291 RepID=UPI0031EE2E6A
MRINHEDGARFAVIQANVKAGSAGFVQKHRVRWQHQHAAERTACCLGGHSRISNVRRRV